MLNQYDEIETGSYLGLSALMQGLDCGVNHLFPWDGLKDEVCSNRAPCVCLRLLQLLLINAMALQESFSFVSASIRSVK